MRGGIKPQVYRKIHIYLVICISLSQKPFTTGYACYIYKQQRHKFFFFFCLSFIHLFLKDGTDHLPLVSGNSSSSFNLAVTFILISSWINNLAAYGIAILTTDLDDLHR